MMRLFFTVLAAMIFYVSSGLNFAQEPETFHQTQIIGRGHVQSIEWHPVKDELLVSTIRGIWIYNDLLEDVAALEGYRLGTYSPDGTAIMLGVNEFGLNINI